MVVRSNKSSCSTGGEIFSIKSAKLTNSNNTETNTICHFLDWQDTTLWSVYQIIPGRKVKLRIPSNILKRKVRKLTEFRVDPLYTCESQEWLQCTAAASDEGGVRTMNTTKVQAAPH